MNKYLNIFNNILLSDENVRKAIVYKNAIMVKTIKILFLSFPNSLEDEFKY